MKYENEFPAGKPFLIQSKLTQIANEVGGLIRRFEALPRFREKVVEWNQDYVQLRAAEEDWEKRRGEQERAAIMKKRLLDQAAGPPEPGWGFEGFSLRDVSDQPVAPEVAFATGPTIGAWFAPELCRAERSGARLPLPVPLEKVELCAKYAALGAIYDCGQEVADSINPWKDSVLDFQFEGVAYTRSLLRAVHRLPESDELRLYAWIEHMEEDLKAWAGADAPAAMQATPAMDLTVATAATSAEDQTGKEPARTGPDNEWPPDDGLHFRPLEFAYQGRVYRLTGMPHRLFRVIATAKKNLHRDEIIERVWKDDERNPEQVTVRSCLSDLKSKLRAHGLDDLAGRIEVRDEYWSFLE